jgi:hypothetical protein
MSSKGHRCEPDPEVSFEGVVDLGSIPPAASGQVDVHHAPTAVAMMTEELMDEIERAKEAARAREHAKTRTLPKFRVPHDTFPGFTDETPTRPGKEKNESGAVRRPVAPELLVPDSGVRVEVTAALPRPPVPLGPPPPPVSFAESIPLLRIPPRPRRNLWPRVLLIVVTIAALLVSALALRRYRPLRHR